MLYDYGKTLDAYKGGYDIGNATRLRDLQVRAGQLAQGGNYEGAAQALLGGGDFQTGVPLLGAARQMTQQQQSLEADKQLMQLLGGGGARAPQQGASVAPTAATPNDIQTRFMSTAQQAGLNNPYGLAALAATGQRESAFSPNKVNATWSDPSERGQAGTSGGILSWRNERLANLQKFAQQRGEQQPSVETQALFFSQEDPTLIPRLNAAKSPQEAAQIMANAWRFAGYNRPGGEAAAREQLTAQYAERFKGQQPQQAAQPMQTVRGVPVANSEADVQRLEAQMAGQQPAPIQMAQAPGAMADLPAQGAPPSQFAVPGQPAPQAPSRAAMPPGDPLPNVSTQDLTAIMSMRNLDDGRRSFFKSILENRQKWMQDEAKATDVQRNYAAAKAQGYTGTILDYQKELRNNNNVTVNNNQAAEDKFKTGLAAKQAERFNKYMEDGDAANARMADINALREQSRAIGSQGSAGNLKLVIAPYAESLGIKIDGASDLQVYDSIIKRLAPTLRAPGSGATSDIEYKGFLASLPQISSNPRAREMILDVFEAGARNDMKRGEIASLLANDQISRADAEKQIRALPDPLTAFREYRKANPDEVGAAIKAAPKEGKSGPLQPGGSTVIDGVTIRRVQ